MGGHGGLNILPQKKWNVYRYDNRAKVARDEFLHEERKNKRNHIAQSKVLSSKISRLKDPTKEETVVKKHINLFQEAEDEINTAKEKYQKYLFEIGHDENTVSEFKSVQQTETPWYLKSTAPLATKISEDPMEDFLNKKKLAKKSKSKKKDKKRRYNLEKLRREKDLRDKEATAKRLLIKSSTLE